MLQRYRVGINSTQFVSLRAASARVPSLLAPLIGEAAAAVGEAHRVDTFSSKQRKAHDMSMFAAPAAYALLAITAGTPLESRDAMHRVRCAVMVSCSQAQL